MSEGCPLCKIPEREALLYNDNRLYLVQTKKMKGHSIRVMVAIKDHRAEPTFEERTKAYSVLINYMQKVMKYEKWFIVEGKYASVKNHFHLIACDSKGTPKELELLHKTPRVEFPLPPQKKILIGIPAYNEERTIGVIVWKSRKYGDVMVVDDGSTDNTAELALYAGAGVTENDKNYGYGYCLSKIFREAKRENYNILITLDADGQHNPDEIPKFLSKFDEGYDIVVGNRFLGGSKVPSYRKKFIEYLKFPTGVEIGDVQCGFRAYNRRAIEEINIKERGMGASLEILQQGKKKGLKIVEVPCTVTYEKTKHSQHPLRHGSVLIERILWSTIWQKPLRYLGGLGFLLLCLGGFSTLQLIQIYVASRYFVLTWATLALIGIIGGLLLLVNAFLIYFLKRGLEESK